MNKAYPKTPKNTCIYAVGDVHGRLDLLDKILIKIAKDSKISKKRHNILVMLGDFIDRGPDSRGVLDRLADVQAGRILGGFKVYLLKGNHEESMLSFLADKDGATWLHNGGAETIASYGLDPKEDVKTLRLKFLKALPKSHRKVLRKLKLSVVLRDYRFVHAGIRPGVAWGKQDPIDLLWIREAFLKSKEPHEHMVVHGHSPQKTPAQYANRIGIDTRAWESGILTCLVMQGLDRRFLST